MARIGEACVGPRKGPYRRDKLFPAARVSCLNDAGTGGLGNPISSCVFMLDRAAIVLPLLAAFALYPLALLIGAASMLPGGNRGRPKWR